MYAYTNVIQKYKCALVRISMHSERNWAELSGVCTNTIKWGVFRDKDSKSHKVQCAKECKISYYLKSFKTVPILDVLFHRKPNVKLILMLKIHSCLKIVFPLYLFISGFISADM